MNGSEILGSQVKVDWAFKKQTRKIKKWIFNLSWIYELILILDLYPVFLKFSNFKVILWAIFNAYILENILKYLFIKIFKVF